MGKSAPLSRRYLIQQSARRAPLHPRWPFNKDDVGQGARVRLNQRIRTSLGYASSPRSVAIGPALLDALQDSLTPERLARLLPQPGPVAMSREYVVALYRGLRIVWLAELVFGDRDAARAWLDHPKVRLQGRAPLDTARTAREADLLERWLITIDEGNLI
ncbi:hypothetical protein JL37_07990 [Achromobacter sp. RTa]|nr:hypothetical protein JL37_07990 [Achromobacter sp. RTa]